MVMTTLGDGGSFSVRSSQGSLTKSWYSPCTPIVGPHPGSMPAVPFRSQCGAPAHQPVRLIKVLNLFSISWIYVSCTFIESRVSFLVYRTA